MLSKEYRPAGDTPRQARYDVSRAGGPLKRVYF